jgi:hypothetical protein
VYLKPVAYLTIIYQCPVTGTSYLAAPGNGFRVMAAGKTGKEKKVPEPENVF